jgi:hypothetical protein
LGFYSKSNLPRCRTSKPKDSAGAWSDKINLNVTAILILSRSAAVADIQVIQTDLGRWDYKHQVLATRKMPPWRILLWTKLIEAVMQN